MRQVGKGAGVNRVIGLEGGCNLSSLIYLREPGTTVDTTYGYTHARGRDCGLSLHMDGGSTSALMPRSRV